MASSRHCLAHAAHTCREARRRDRSRASGPPFAHGRPASGETRAPSVGYSGGPTSRLNRSGGTFGREPVVDHKRSEIITRLRKMPSRQRPREMAPAGCRGGQVEANVEPAGNGTTPRSSGLLPIAQEGGASTDPTGPSNLREAGVVSVGKLCAGRIDVGRRIDDACGSWCLAVESIHVVL